MKVSKFGSKVKVSYDEHRALVDRHEVLRDKVQNLYDVIEITAFCGAIAVGILFLSGIVGLIWDSAEAEGAYDACAFLSPESMVVSSSTYRSACGLLSDDVASR